MRILKKISDEFWWDVVRKCDYATFYHTPIWKDLGERVSAGRQRNETFGAILSNGVRVVFPLMSTRRFGPFRWMSSSFDAHYGGFIADGPVLDHEAVALYKHAIALPNLSLFITDNPLGQMMPDDLKSKFNLIVEDLDFMLELDDDFDSVFSRIRRSHRQSYRKGIQSGVKVRLATSYDDYRAFYDCYRDAVSRWGESESYGYSWEHIAKIYEMNQRYPENVKLWLMIVEERIVGGRIVFCWGKHVTGWMGTAHRDFLKYNVTPVADVEAIRDTINQGYKYFDFGGSNRKEGVIDYKRGFKANEVPMGSWLYESPLITTTRSLYKNIRSKLRAGRPVPATIPAPTPE